MMRAWIPLGLAVLALAMVVPGCGSGPDDPDDPEGLEDDEYGADGSNDAAEYEVAEIAFFQWAKRGDGARGIGAPGGMTAKEQNSQYLLLYTRGWMKEKTFGGPFEGITKRHNVSPGWKEIKQTAYRDLKAFFWNSGFFDELPGTDFVEREPFEDPAYSTKAISFTMGNERKIVFLDSVTKGDGTDPRWNKFNACVEQFINVYTKIEDVRAQVQMGDVNQAFKAYMKGK